MYTKNGNRHSCSRQRKMQSCSGLCRKFHSASLCILYAAFRMHLLAGHYEIFDMGHNNSAFPSAEFKAYPVKVVVIIYSTDPLFE